MQLSLSNTIYQKLQKLVKEFDHLKKENQQLLRDLDGQLAVNKESREKVELLESQLALLKSSTGQMDTTAKKEMERRLQQYIKDIDNAITLLNE